MIKPILKPTPHLSPHHTNLISSDLSTPERAIMCLLALICCFYAGASIFMIVDIIKTRDSAVDILFGVLLGLCTLGMSVPLFLLTINLAIGG